MTKRVLNSEKKKGKNMNEGEKPKLSRLALASVLFPGAGIIVVWLLTLIRSISKGEPCFSVIVIIFIIVPPVTAGLGIASVFKIQKSKGQARGTSLGIGAIVIGTAATTWMVLVGIPRIRSVSPSMNCWGNLHSLGTAMLVYASTYEEYPTPERWCDLLIEHTSITEKQFRCMGNKKARCSYAMNPNCKPGSLPNVVLLFETKGGWNQFGGTELLTFENHEGHCNVLFNDISGLYIRPSGLMELKWTDGRGERIEEANSVEE